MSYKKKITMFDIAKDANVSISTVSMVLNNKQNVSFNEETTNKIYNSAKKLGYIFKKKNEILEKNEFSKDIIAIFCPNISNAYYSTISQAIEQAAYSKNYKTVIFTTFRDENIEKKMVNLVMKMNFRGIIFASIPSSASILKEVSESFPIVAVGTKSYSLDAPIIEMNYYAEGILIGEHLAELGHKNIIFITTTLDNTSSFSIRYLRLQGIKDVYQKKFKKNDYNIIVKENKVTPEQERNNIDLEFEIGYNSTSDFLENLPQNVTAFIGNNDMVAYGIINAISDKGFSIPKDFTVCGFDNDFPSKLNQISLTTVENFIREKGKKAFDLLEDSIQKRKNKIIDNSILTVEYKPKLIKRKSSDFLSK